MVEFIKKLNERQALVKENDKYYMVSQSRELVGMVYPPELEVAVFPCSSDGTVTKWFEVNGERGTTLEEFLPKLLKSNKVNLYDGGENE